jgi:hypothetical protein
MSLLIKEKDTLLWFKHIYSTKHLTSEQYLQSTFWDWAESYKAYECPLPTTLNVPNYF